MLDINACNLAAKGSWIRKLIGTENSKWKTLTWYMLNTSPNNLTDSNCLWKKTIGKSKFHTQIFQAWSEINSFEPTTLKEIINQSLTENIYIRVDNKPINANFFGTINKSKFKEMKIKDII